MFATAVATTDSEIPPALCVYFNHRCSEFLADENEPAIRKYLRSIRAL